MVRDLTDGKLDPRGREGCFVGYDAESKGCRIYWPNSRSIGVEPDLIFEDRPASTSSFSCLNCSGRRLHALRLRLHLQLHRLPLSSNPLRSFQAQVTSQPHRMTHRPHHRLTRHHALSHPLCLLTSPSSLQNAFESRLRSFVTYWRARLMQEQCEAGPGFQKEFNPKMGC